MHHHNISVKKWIENYEKLFNICFQDKWHINYYGEEGTKLHQEMSDSSYNKFTKKEKDLILKKAEELYQESIKNA